MTTTSMTNGASQQFSFTDAASYLDAKDQILENLGIAPAEIPTFLVKPLCSGISRIEAKAARLVAEPKRWHRISADEALILERVFGLVMHFNSRKAAYRWTGRRMCLLDERAAKGIPGLEALWKREALLTRAFLAADDDCRLLKTLMAQGTWANEIRRKLRGARMRAVKRKRQQSATLVSLIRFELAVMLWIARWQPAHDSWQRAYCRHEGFRLVNHDTPRDREFLHAMFGFYMSDRNRAIKAKLARLAENEQGADGYNVTDGKGDLCLSEMFPYFTNRVSRIRSYMRARLLNVSPQTCGRAARGIRMKSLSASGRTSVAA